MVSQPYYMAPNDEGTLQGLVSRVLVVDDYEPWRRYFFSMLEKQQQYAVIGEGLDGLEAVQKAEQLQPDIILLDIGLPNMNGIEAARRIRERAPNAKIVFVTENSSLDVVEEALRTGAQGYIVKEDAGGELLIAVRAVLRGETFLGRRFAGHDFIAG
jgi:DNA-binding NarL/FixJ family response regulator